MAVQFTNYRNLRWDVEDGLCTAVTIQFYFQGGPTVQEVAEWMRSKECKGKYTIRESRQIEDDQYEAANQHRPRRIDWPPQPPYTCEHRDVYFFTDQNTAFLFKLKFG